MSLKKLQEITRVLPTPQLSYSGSVHPLSDRKVLENLIYAEQRIMSNDYGMEIVSQIMGVYMVSLQMSGLNLAKMGFEEAETGGVL